MGRGRSPKLVNSDWARVCYSAAYFLMSCVKNVDFPFR